VGPDVFSRYAIKAEVQNWWVRSFFFTFGKRTFGGAFSPLFEENGPRLLSASLDTVDRIGSVLSGDVARAQGSSERAGAKSDRLEV
jgi:hypothetical protein